MLRLILCERKWKQGNGQRKKVKCESHSAKSHSAPGGDLS